MASARWYWRQEWSTLKLCHSIYLVVIKNVQTMENMLTEITQSALKRIFTGEQKLSDNVIDDQTGKY